MNDKVELAAFRQVVVGDLALFSRLTGGELDRPLLEWLRASRYPQGLGLDLAGEAAEKATNHLSRAVAQLPAVGFRQGRDELAADYTAIFFSAERQGLATESYWLAGGGSARTSLVEEWYARYGYSVSDRLHRPADSLAFQFGFLAHLLDDGDAPPAEMLQAAKQFLGSHLISWVPRFCETMARHSVTPFYQGLALLIGAYLPSLEKNIHQVEGDILSVPA